MIKNYNPTMRKALLVILPAMLLIFSCKKNSQERPLESAKDWYQKSTKTQNILKSDNDVERKINKEVNWEASKPFTLLDGTEIVTAPMAVNYTNGIKVGGSFMLIIAKNDGKYRTIVVYDSRKNYFNGKLSLPEITAIYNNALAQNLAHKKNKLLQEKNKKYNVGIKNEPVPECFDYFWVEYFYDAEGNIYGYEEWFLFSACPDNGTGGVGGTNEEVEVNVGSPASQDLYTMMDTDEVEDNVLFKRCYLWWKFHDAFTWYAESKEYGWVKVTNNGNTRTWYKLQHLSHLEVGTWALGEMQLEGTPNFTALSVSGPTATMSVDYQLKYRIEFTVGVATIAHPGWKTKMLWSAHSWNTNFNQAVE